jgi:hypothetical protein
VASEGKARKYQMANQTIQNVEKSVEAARSALVKAGDLDPIKLRALKKRLKRAQRKHLCMTTLEARRTAQTAKKTAKPDAEAPAETTDA